MDTQALLTELLGSLYAGNPDAIAVYDRGGFFLSCNEAALQLSGQDFTRLAGSHFSDHVVAADRERMTQAFNTALAGFTEHVETTLKDRAGSIVPVEVYLFPARIGTRVEGVFAQARDRQALREAELSIGLSQERFRSLFEYYPDAIMALKGDGLISRVNVALETATGYYGEELINRRWTDIVAPEYRAQAAEAFERASSGEPGEFDSFLLGRSGERIDVQLKLVPLRTGESIDGAYAVARNVVAQRRAERAIAAQGERIRELYLAAATRGESIDVQIDKTLALGCRLFGFHYGYVTRFDGGSLTILNAVGEGGAIAAGSVYPVETTLSRFLTGDRQSLFIPDLDEPPWTSDPARSAVPWRSYFAVRLVVNDRDFGALAFAAREPHAEIAETDRDLLQLMGLFVAAALEREQHAERMEQLAFYDALTGLPNRVLFDDRLRQAMASAKRYRRDFSVMYLDLDDFKEINDRYGHPIGDLVLKAVANRLTSVLRQSDTVARLGGDEFAILQPVVKGAGDAAELARKIVQAMRTPLRVKDGEHVMHTSIGIALYPEDGLSPEELMDRADRALYHAKRTGRNRWVSAAQLREERLRD